MKRPKGIVKICRGGWPVCESQNLFVNAGLPALANLLAGATTGEYALAIGFGSGNTAPTVADTDLGLAPKYYNAVGEHTFPNPGSVQFSYALTASTDSAATGITVREVGLFANTAAIGLPTAIGTANPTWTASSVKALGALLVDGNGNVQRCTTAGTTGSAEPSWASALNATTTDGSAIWTLVALHTAPGPMLARALVPAFLFDGSANYQGTWTFTF